MKKFGKILALILCAALVLAFAGCGNTAGDTSSKTDGASDAAGDNGEKGTMPAIPKDQVKVGVIHISDPAEGSGYTYTHDLGIQAMQKNVGLEDSQIVRKNKVEDTNPTAIENAIRECIEECCNIIFGTSLGYMETMAALAEEYP